MLAPSRRDSGRSTGLDSTVRRACFHFVETVGAEKEVGQIKPGAGSGVTGGDGGAIFALGFGWVFVFFSDVGQNPVRHGGIERGNRVGLSVGFVLAAADDAGRVEIELGQIDAGFPALGIQFDGALELDANFLGQAGGGEDADAGGFFSVGASEPEMIKALLRIELRRRARRR